MASVYKRGKSWYLSWTDSHNRRHRNSLGRITAAEARASLTQHRLRVLNNPHGVTPTVTLEEFSKPYLQWYKAQYPSSYDRVSRIFRCHLIPEFGAEPMNLIGRVRATEFRSARLAEAKPSTVNKELKTLKACLQRAVDWDVLSLNPLDKGRDTLFVPKREDRPPVWYTTQQLAALYAVSSPRNAALWKLMANTGLRRAEMLGLRRTDVADDRITVVSLHERPTKGRKTRTIPLNAAAQEALQALLAGKGGGEYVLRQMSARSLSRCFELNARKAGLEGTIHCLRHTFCAQLVMAGVPLRTIQVLAGHADIKTTEIYAHLAPDYLANAVTAIAL